MTVLFVCSGNTCRSPMAMALFRLKQTDIKAESAGIFAIDGQPASYEAIKVCAQLGADLSDHSSRFLTPEIFQNADVVVVMGTSHKHQLILNGYPLEKIFTLSELTGIVGDIPDPYMQGESAYIHTVSLLSKHIDVLVKILTENI